MALDTLTAALRLDACGYFGTGARSSNILHMYSANLIVKPLAVEAKGNTRTESPNILNRRQKKKALWWMTRSTRSACFTEVLCRNPFGAILLVEAAERVGEELIKACRSQYR